MNMRAFDFSPLYRATVGFDRLALAMDSLMRNDASTPSYPPYNIEKTGKILTGSLLLSRDSTRTRFPSRPAMAS